MTESLETILTRVLGTLGLPEPGSLNRLRRDWDLIAGEPWKDRSQPLVLRNRELVVESLSSAMVSVLRYATGDLQRRIDDVLGPGHVQAVRVVPPRAEKRPPT